jgi:hypothetical protein
LTAARAGAGGRIMAGTMEPTLERPRSRKALLAGFVLALVMGWVVSRFVCVQAYVRYGVLVPRCPDGLLRQTLIVDCQGLRRTGEGTVRVAAVAHYTTGDTDQHLTTLVRRLTPSLALVDGAGHETALVPARGWKREPALTRRAEIALPGALPDGDYLLRARVRSSIGDDTLDVPLPVYAPARVHVITDRPLYEPGHTVQYRAVVLRASDFAPLDGRPGKWVVRDPTGEVVLEEKAQAGNYGVVAGSFPLDAGAPQGAWRVEWVSGEASDGVPFTVEPFTLPRFRVEAAAERPFYRPGERPTVRGKVLYSAGPPVQGAAIELGWSVDGAWPPPTSWINGALPTRAVSDAGGAFTLQLPAVPRDLRGRVTLQARMSATDPAGDRAEGRAAVLLSEDGVQVAAVTELEDRLVEGFNNRLYLRVSSPAGVVLGKTDLVVKRAWEANDPGITATTDEDGVAALQIDPGPPVNVVIPAMPVRPPVPEPAVTRTEARDLMTGDEPSLADQRAMDRWNELLAACAGFVEAGSAGATLGAQVAAAGAVVATATDGTALERCLAQRLAGLRLPPGRERLYRLGYTVTSDLPRLTVEVDGAPAPVALVGKALAEAALEARSCLPRDSREAALPRLLLWRARSGKKGITISFAPDPRHADRVVAAPAAACIEHELQARRWPELEEKEDGRGFAGVGIARFTVHPSRSAGQAAAQDTTLVAYELTVSARAQGTQVGHTRIVLPPGAVPPIRLRASPVVAEPGAEVEVTILRGPGWSGTLPEKLALSHLGKSQESPVDGKTRTARFRLPADAQGWFEAAFGGGRALVFVRRRGSLAVSVQPDAERYQPGKTAQLTLRTTSGGQGTAAAVGLFGVDATMADLAPLPGPDDLARLRPRPTMNGAAFAVLEVGALEMGRIRGANAASATVLRVAAVPSPAALDAVVSAQASPPFDPLEALTDNFYNVLGELHARVRDWETSAPKDEQMRPATMARLWTAALDACAKRKEAVTDAYGRRLALHRLPPDLLALTDPRMVVVNGTRLPEDVESWPAWVAKERP